MVLPFPLGHSRVFFLWAKGVNGNWFPRLFNSHGCWTSQDWYEQLPLHHPRRGEASWGIGGERALPGQGGRVAGSEVNTVMTGEPDPSDSQRQTRWYKTGFIQVSKSENGGTWERRTRPRSSEKLAQSHTANKWQSQEQNLRLLTPNEFILLTTLVKIT